MLMHVLHSQRGVAFPLALIIMMIFSIIALRTLSVVTEEVRMVKHYEESIRALYLAEAGLHEALAHVYRDAAYLGTIYTSDKIVYTQNGQSELGCYNADVTQCVDSKITNDRKITAIGKVSNMTRKIEATIIINGSDLSFIDYAVYAGQNAAFLINSDITQLAAWALHWFNIYILGINGDMYVDGQVTIGDYYKIDGDITAAGNAHLAATVKHTGCIVEKDQKPPYPLPDRDKYEAASSMRYSANDSAMVQLNGKQTLRLSQAQRPLAGIVFVDGDIIVDAPALIMGDTTLFATGNITVTSRLSTLHNLGLVSLRDIEFQSYGIFGNPLQGYHDAAFIHAAGEIKSSNNGQGTDIGAHYGVINGSVIGNRVSLANVRINYNAGLKENTGPPLPQNMGATLGIAMQDWDDIVSKEN